MSVPTRSGANSFDLAITCLTESELRESLGLLAHTIVFQRLVGEPVYPEEIETQFGLYYVRIPTKYVSDEVNAGIDQAFAAATKRAAANTTELMISFYAQDKETKKQSPEIERWRIPFQLVTHTANRPNLVDSLKFNMNDIVKKAQEREGFRLLPDESITFHVYCKDLPQEKPPNSLFGMFKTFFS